MSLRERLRQRPPPDESDRDRMVAVVFREDGQILARWKIRRADGREIDMVESVGDALKTQIMGRAAVQTMLDNISADTYDRALDRVEHTR